MPKIQWERLPREKWAHLRGRAKERKVSAEDLFDLAEWKAQDPDVPDGDWQSDRALRSPRAAWLAGEAPENALDYPVNPGRSSISRATANWPLQLITAQAVFETVSTP